jgi:hypothetical protein
MVSVRFFYLFDGVCCDFRPLPMFSGRLWHFFHRKWPECAKKIIVVSWFSWCPSAEIFDLGQEYFRSSKVSTICFSQNSATPRDFFQQTIFGEKASTVEWKKKSFGFC